MLQLEVLVFKAMVVKDTIQAGIVTSLWVLRTSSLIRSYFVDQ